MASAASRVRAQGKISFLVLGYILLQDNGQRGIREPTENIAGASMPPKSCLIFRTSEGDYTAVDANGEVAVPADVLTEVESIFKKNATASEIVRPGEAVVLALTKDALASTEYDARRTLKYLHIALVEHLDIDYYESKLIMLSAVPIDQLKCTTPDGKTDYYAQRELLLNFSNGETVYPTEYPVVKSQFAGSVTDVIDSSQGLSVTISTSDGAVHTITGLGAMDADIKQGTHIVPGQIIGVSIHGPAADVDRNVAALKSSNWAARYTAADALGLFKDPRAVDPLAAALNDDDLYVRRMAAESLGKIGDARAVESLAAALGDSDSHVRRLAVGALDKIGDVRAVEPLSAALKDEDSDVRRLAAEALGKIGDARAVILLRADLKQR
jgi:hypothetical protein